MTKPTARRVVSPTSEEAASRAAAYIAEVAAAAIEERGVARIAVSGGKTPARMLAYLARIPIAWRHVEVWQVDERVAPEGHADRNSRLLRAALASSGARLFTIDVPAEWGPTVSPAAGAYAAQIAKVANGVFDLIHLGLGDDGHTASLFAGDSTLDAKADVAVSHVYQGRLRVTMTLPVLARARKIAWLVTGASKRAAVSQALAGDPSIPAGRVQNADSVWFLDAAATGGQA